MAVTCDATKQMVVYGDPVDVSQESTKTKIVNPIKDEQFVQCMNERSSIVPTQVGRVGLCRGHLEHYIELTPEDQRKYFRMRHGKIVAGDPQEVGST